ncbi:uncharacterized protein FTJAE_4859 [Fusarium tjaetaba]|uniref:Uncharacterized protein n=1 Tax=Fusarium tjaetaba TaxID=1567544 RepID=A0A8H5RRB9_9HYPO|nr:uncharacterized protein FTJAE_4859 [Fusarium tjaetaba]KAF5639521.1 hypothetical protein FTJAE_4859 [Fusarium tjaetaba]
MKATGMCSLEGLLVTLGHEIPSRESPSVVDNVTHVRICKAAEPETFAAEVPVVKNNAFTDVTKRELQSLERPVGSEARGAGSFAAPVLHVIDIDEAEKVTASL